MKKIILALTVLLPNNLIAEELPDYTAPLQEYIFSTHGIPGVETGMSLDQAEEISKQNFTMEDWGPEVETCATGISETGLYILLHDNKIESVEVDASTETIFQTKEGLKTGDSLTRIKQIYPEAEPIHDPNGEDPWFLVRKPDNTGYVFKTDGTNLYGIKSGLIPAITLKEGCL